MLRASVFGRLVCVKGTVVRVSSIRPLCTRLAFRCRTCATTLSLALQHGKYTTPTKVCTRTLIRYLFSATFFLYLKAVSYIAYMHMAFLSAFTHLLFVFYHLVRKARLSQSYLHPHPQFSSYTDCRLADHQVSISCTVKNYSKT